MAMTLRERAQLRNWTLKSLGGPLLASIFLVMAIFSENPELPWHILALAALLFGGFPLGNVIFEKPKFYLLTYYGLQALFTFSLYFYSSWILPENFSVKFLPPPVDFLCVFTCWFLSDMALPSLMPNTHQKILAFRYWRENTLRKLIEDHY